MHSAVEARLRMAPGAVSFGGRSTRLRAARKNFAHSEILCYTEIWLVLKTKPA